MTNIIMYTKDNCPYCISAKSLLTVKNQSYQEMKIGLDITREEFMETFPEVKTVPFIIIDGEKVGGYNELTEWYSKPSRSFLAE